MKSQLRRYLGSLVFVFLLCLSVALGATAGVLFVYNSDLPQVNSLEDYHPSLVTDIYADDGQVIGSFALERRIVVTYDEIPQLLKDAIISVEDQNFRSHWGIDIYGVARAGLKDVMAGRFVEGGSTLTQQLSKNLFLTPERRFRRKIQEAMLAIQIERYYTKDQILTMYVNQNFMGHGQYGFAAAADFYFGKTKLKDLTVEEAALLAALPRSPINYSPVVHPDRARMRRDYAIDRMVAEKKITFAQGEDAKSHPIKIAEKQRPDELAPYFVEELRRYLEKKYGTFAVHEGGLKVFSTLNVEQQKAANAGVRAGLRDYDKRHGWRGADRNLLTEGVEDINTYELPDWKLPIRTNDIVPGIVLELTKASAIVKIREYQAVLSPQDFAWTNSKSASDILKKGDIALFQIRSLNPANLKLEVALEQKPKVQGSFLAIEPKSGEVKAMVGGYDFDESKFNRATQALRQTGSSFKPFVYTVAIDNGMTLDDTIVDTPVSFGGYSPGNYDGKFEGTIGIRRAFADSRNVPAVKLLAKVGVQNLIPYVRRFGITSKIDPVLPIALGAADVTLIEMVSAYSTFPNDGVRVVPQMIRRVTDYEGNVLEENFSELRDVIPAETARTMVDLMQEPIKQGTATKALELKRPIAGKTGTTNDFTDAWFIGYTPSLVAGAWIGFDEKVTLGDKETGAKAALPMWMDFIREVYKDKPIEEFNLGPKPATVAAPAPPASAAAPVTRLTQ
jgi:penicillin-binding protein 1A